MLVLLNKIYYIKDQRRYEQWWEKLIDGGEGRLRGTFEKFNVQSNVFFRLTEISESKILTYELRKFI